MFHPWRRVRDTPEMNVEYSDTEVVGCYSFRTQTATLATEQLQAERRCAINHEWWHHKRGPFPEAARAREEKIIEILSARELISIFDLGEAMAWTSDMSEVADELWVDLPCLWARLEALTLQERKYLDRRVHKVTGSNDDPEDDGGLSPDAFRSGGLQQR